jgi:glyoxylase-like metal-dependent hydrolase (beta-lactamase superfamily II)
MNMKDGLKMQTVTRRAFLGSSAAVTAGAFLSPRFLFAQQAELPAVIVQGRATGATAKITTQKLRGNVTALMGSGGNIAVLTGPQGKLLVDSGYSTSQPQITEALAALGADRVTHLINTHWHFDHTDGNEWMHTAGATILAHDKTKERLSTTQTIAAFHATIPASPAGAIPTQTFAETHTLKLNGETLNLAHYRPAHTDTDISIHFKNADVLHAGDTWFNGFYPFIDYSTGGNIDGMIAAADRTLKMTSATTIIIPGHGPIGNKAQLSEYHDMLVAVRESVAGLKKQGKSQEEVIAAKPSAAYDAKWGGGFMKPEVFLGLVYQGV